MPGIVDAVIFDLDDTLLDWSSAHEAGLDAVHEDHFPHVPRAHVGDAYAKVVEENMRDFHATGRWWYARDRLERLADHIPTDADLAHVVDSFARGIRSGMQLLDGAMDAVHAARDAGLATALLTNGPSDVQRPKVEGLGLEEVMDHIAITGETGIWKPHADAFHGVTQALGVEASRTMMVGDSHYFDIAPARKLGMTTAWVGGDDPAGADHLLDVPGDLVDLILHGDGEIK